MMSLAILHYILPVFILLAFDVAPNIPSCLDWEVSFLSLATNSKSLVIP